MVPQFNEEELTRVYQVLGHPLRRRIISYLGEHGKASFTELRRNLKVSVGTLYYNLDQLRDFVTQDADKKYLLTQKGLLTYEVIKHDSERFQEYASMWARKRALAPLYDIISKVFMPDWLTMLSNNLSLLAVLASLSLALGLLFSVICKLELSIMFYYPSSSSVLPILEYIFSWIFIFLTSELLTSVFHGQEGHKLELLLLTAVSLLPLSVYPFLYWLVSLLIPESLLIFNVPIKRYVIGFLLTFSQFLTIGYLTTSISTTKHMRSERAFVVVSIVYYLNLMYNLLIRQSVLLPI
ncbi:MAG: helix-turn-helix transcriptional regulator [Thermoprotei archaeon]|nr:helix-turn-helix transcriptional regulator [Thermoprotei archaeon]